MSRIPHMIAERMTLSEVEVLKRLHRFRGTNYDMPELLDPLINLRLVRPDTATDWPCITTLGYEVLAEINIAGTNDQV